MIVAQNQRLDSCESGTAAVEFALVLPALAALTILGWMFHGHKAGQAMMVGAGLFVVSLTFRIVHLDVCATWPLGTHFLWHLFNAAVLYTVLRGAIAERQHPFSQEVR